jgi:hypothetical protein
MMNNQVEIGQANAKCIPDIYTPVLDVDETGALDTEADGPYIKTNFPRSYALRPRHDRVNAVVTFAFIGIFLTTIILAFVVIMGFSQDWAATKDLLQLILPAEIALAGSTMGFYFGSRTNRSDRR